MQRTVKSLEKEILSKCKKAGLDVRLNYDDTKIDSVKIPFSPKTWVDVLDRDGEILGVCCGNISRIRDILCQAICDSSYIDVRELAEAHSLIVSHGCSDTKRPLKTVVKLWEKVKEIMGEDIPKTRSSKFDPNNVKDCLQALETALPALIFNQYGFGNDDAVRKHLKKVQDVHMLRTVIPSIRTLHKRIAELNPGPLEGFAVVDKQTGMVLEGQAGLLILKDEALATEIAKLDSAVVRKCKISLENGIEFF